MLQVNSCPSVGAQLLRNTNDVNAKIASSMKVVIPKEENIFQFQNVTLQKDC